MEEKVKKRRITRRNHLIHRLAVLLDRCLREDCHDFSGASVTDPDLRAIEHEVIAARRQHGAGPDGPRNVIKFKTLRPQYLARYCQKRTITDS